MDISGLLLFLFIGGLAGWIAGKVMKGSGFGIIGDIVVGILGAAMGGFLFNLFGLTASGLIGEIITATIGAIVLLYIVVIIKKV